MTADGDERPRKDRARWVVSLGRRLHRLVNPIDVALLRGPLHGLLSRSVALLTVTGRRTGAQYVLPVQYARFGDVVLVLPGGHEQKTWWRNLQTPAPVRIRIAGRELLGVGEAISGAERPQGVAEALQSYLARFPSSARVRGLTADGDGRFPASRLLQVARGEVMVRIRLDAPVDARPSVG